MRLEPSHYEEARGMCRGIGSNGHRAISICGKEVHLPYREPV
jgi:hypothetical protein